MLSVLILLGFFVVWGITTKYIYKDFGEFFISLFLGFLLGLTFSLCSFAAVYTSIVALLPNVTNTYSIEIVSLKDKSSIEGSFVLGSGTIKDKDYYIYYSKTQDGGYKRNKIEAENVTIYQTNKETPKLKFTDITPLKNETTEFWIGETEIFTDQTDVKLIVPENTIIEQFKLE